jgi:hypothetical protein
MTTQELIQRRDELSAAKHALLAQCFTIESLADYMVEQGVVRLTPSGRVLPRERSKLALARTLRSDKNQVKHPELRLECVQIDPDNPSLGHICTREEGERRLRVELERQERRLKRKHRQTKKAASS